MTCDELDRLVTPFIDGECTHTERAEAIAHLRQCESCHARVEAESTAKHLLQAHAAVARTMGEGVPWRPRVFRLGRPTLPLHPTLLFLLIAGLGAGLLGVWLRPTPVLAIGVIGDSYCLQFHRFTARFNVNEHECTLGCVKRGAEFVLVTDSRVYQIRNQQLPELTTFANRRVKVEGRWDEDGIVVARIKADDP
jgi:anti-sigma factor RsiW